jgi:hypothetical protein
MLLSPTGEEGIGKWRVEAVSGNGFFFFEDSEYH